MPETLPTASPRGLGEQPGLTTARMSWHRKAERLLSVTDLLVLIAAVAGAQLLRFGLARTRLLDGAGAETISYTLFSALLVLVWWAALGVGGARQAKILGAGSEEYRRVVRISLWLFAALAVLAYQMLTGQLPYGLQVTRLRSAADLRRLRVAERNERQAGGSPP